MMSLIGTLINFFDVSTILLLLVVFLLTVWVLELNQTRGMPPGPFHWPIVGCLPQLMMYGQKNFIPFLEKMCKKYDGMFTIKFGDYPALFIYDFELLKEAFVDQGNCFSMRPRMPSTKEILEQDRRALVMADGRKWQVIRRFAISTMRDMGVGKKTIEEKIQTEFLAVESEFMKEVGKLFDPSPLVQKAVVNIIAAVIFGERYDYKDQSLEDVLVSMRKQVTANSFLDPRDMIKILRSLPTPRRYKEMKHYRRTIERIVVDQIDSHKKTFKPDDIRDVIDQFIEKQQEQAEFFDDEVLTQLILELFFAGSETTATTLNWMILYLALYPDIQKKCQNEIDEVLGAKMPAMADKPNLPYVEATISEIQRIRTIAPLGVLHSTAYDTTLRGYKIPKGTWVFPMLYHIHSDPKQVPDSLQFKPERFLDASGKYEKHENLVPFGIGPRICAGEPLAKMELFIFTTSFLQKFTFSKPLNKEISTEPIIGFTVSPKPQEIIINVR